MRRAEERRSASVMISNSIRWSLVGNDVDCRMKTSEPRTFSWISTKISMSAKRRTTAWVSGLSRWAAIASASLGLELPATSLIAPFFAAMRRLLRSAPVPRTRRDNKEPRGLAIGPVCCPEGFWPGRVNTRANRCYWPALAVRMMPAASGVESSLAAADRNAARLLRRGCRAAAARTNSGRPRSAPCRCGRSGAASLSSARDQASCVRRRPARPDGWPACWAGRLLGR